MPETTNNNQMLSALLFGPQNAVKLQQAQQNQALANAILQQGLTPVSTEGRSIGGVGYKVSPMEGLAKLADVLSGKLQQNQAIKDQADIYGNMGSSLGGSGSGSDPFHDAKGNLSSLATAELLSGNRAVGEYIRPTEQQKNFGNQLPQWVNNQVNPGAVTYQQGLGSAAAGNAPVGQLPPGVGAATQPVAIGSSQGFNASPETDALSPARGNNPAPPIDAQLAGGAPQVPASQLQPSAMDSRSPIPTPPPSAMPAPMQGETNDQYQARLKSFEAGSKTEAEDTGKNLADATKTFNVAATSFPRAMQRFDELRIAAKNASYGSGVSDEEPGKEFHLISPDYSREFARTGVGNYFEPKVSLANQKIDQASKQGILAELGPQLQGLRGNNYLEMIASGASGLNAADPPEAKQQAINGLQDQYISNMKSLAQQRRSYGDPSAPSDMDLAQLIAKNSLPSTMVNIITPDGKFGKVSAQHLPDLVKSGGQIK